jgi:hypothetical protein
MATNIPLILRFQLFAMKTFALAACAFLGVGSAHAQGFYIKTGVGGSVPWASVNIASTGTPYNGTVVNLPNGPDSLAYISYNLRRASLAPAISLSMSGGYMFNNHIGLELGLLYGSSRQYEYVEDSVLINSIYYTIRVTTKARNTLLINPSLLVQTGGEQLNIYTRFGLLLPINTKIDQHQIFTNLPGMGRVQSQDYFWKIKQQFSLGICASAGFTMKLTDRNSLFGELNLLAMSAYTKEGNLKDLIVDGEPGYLKYTDPADRKIVFSNNFTAPRNNFQRQPTYAIPFSSVGAQIGIIYRFGDAQTPTRQSTKEKPSVRPRGGSFR